jgi:polysaccharide export outer membrane protein
MIRPSNAIAAGLAAAALMVSAAQVKAEDPDTARSASGADASAATPGGGNLAAAKMVGSEALASHGAANVGADYKIGAGDQLDINVFDIPDLSRSLQVDAGGNIELPLVGEVTAGGKTSEQLADVIAADLKRRYVKNPLVTVVVKDAVSERVTVDGAVIAPGSYPLTGPTTLLQAVALAKGPDPKIADEHKVELFRMVNGERQGAVYDLAAIRSGKAVDPAVHGRDVVEIPESGGKKMWHGFVEIAPALALFRY